MRKYLTIGELAKLLNISAHNIRYYEKEGLITPTHMSDSGYRLYDYNDVYQLSGIMILRDSDIPIKQIKRLVDDYSAEDYLAAIRQSYQKVTDQIARLQTLQKQLKHTMELSDRMGENKRAFFKKHLPERRLKIIKRSDYQMSYTIKQLYDIFNKNHIDMSRMYRSDTIYYLTEEDISFCIMDDADDYDLEPIVCDKGQYLCYRFFDDADKVLEKRIAELFKYIVKNSVDYEGELLLIVGGKTSMISDTGFTNELQIKIREC